MSAAKLPRVRRVGRAQGLAMLDELARAELGISGQTFIRRWNQGKFAKKGCDRPGVVRVAMLLPFAT